MYADISTRIGIVAKKFTSDRWPRKSGAISKAHILTGTWESFDSGQSSLLATVPRRGSPVCWLLARGQLRTTVGGQDN